ncbi:hypothetical protein [Helicobacter anatolicus]|uniref:hypothetical protein n=1 Tax=Helicobacter anatolicus TaxID=2905874 RepID=UPI001E498BCD|nr:hypothetical protein [Helicobacter anatolicus]MCE3037421.1 hypothetical protein [Helicobacter anatolicus]MCE3040214.1 hypothetical protein [Helicobacter anatolicus]
MEILRKIYHKRAILIYLCIIGIICFYILSITMTGKYSLRILIENQNLEKKLDNEILELRLENAKLRKELFEIKGLEP